MIFASPSQTYTGEKSKRIYTGVKPPITSKELHSPVDVVIEVLVV